MHVLDGIPRRRHSPTGEQLLQAKAVASHRRRTELAIAVNRDASVVVENSHAVCRQRDRPHEFAAGSEDRDPRQGAIKDPQRVSTASDLRGEVELAWPSATATDASLIPTGAVKQEETFGTRLQDGDATRRQRDRTDDARERVVWSRRLHPPSDDDTFTLLRLSAAFARKWRASEFVPIAQSLIAASITVRRAGCDHEKQK